MASNPGITVAIVASRGPGRYIGPLGIMARLSNILGFLLLCAGCEKQPVPPHVVSPELAIHLAEGRTNAIRDHLSSTMSDEEFLRAIGYDPTTLTSHRDNGVDGHSMTYTNNTTYVVVTRSFSTGISILRLRPKDQQRHWTLDNK